MRLVPLLLLPLVSASGCPESSESWFYLGTSFSDVPCSFTYSLSDSLSLLVSPSAVSSVSSHQSLLSKGEVNWLLKCGENFSAPSMKAVSNKFVVINQEYSFVSFPSSSMPEMELAFLQCRKQEVSYKYVFASSAATSSSVSLPPSRFLKSIEKDAYVTAVGEPDLYMDWLASLSGAKPLPITPPKTTKTRYTGTQGNVDAANWIGKFFSDQQLDSWTQTFSVSGKTTYNVIGEMLGTTRPQEIVVVGAHFDSTSQSPTTLAPGAVDNGSGAVGIMLLAAAALDVDFDRTIHFVVFGGEEQGMYGSAHYVSEAKKKGENIVGALVMDMIGYSNRYFGVKIEGTKDASIQALMQLYAKNLNMYAPQLSQAQSTNSFGSDHVSFQKAGIPAFLAIEQDDTDYPAYHRTTDVVQNVNKDQSIGILQGLAGTLYDLANGQ